MRQKNEIKISAREIRRIRKAMGFSQEDFARFLWVTYSTLNRWEARRAVPFGLPLQILTIVQKDVCSPSFKATLCDPRAVDPLFLLYRLLKPRCGNPRNRGGRKNNAR
jgi:transcriptional regulator with XRE-family HTH domain